MMKLNEVNEMIMVLRDLLPGVEVDDVATIGATEWYGVAVTTAEQVIVIYQPEEQTDRNYWQVDVTENASPTDPRVYSFDDKDAAVAFVACLCI